MESHFFFSGTIVYGEVLFFRTVCLVFCVCDRVSFWDLGFTARLDWLVSPWHLLSLLPQY